MSSSVLNICELLDHLSLLSEVDQCVFTPRSLDTGVRNIHKLELKVAIMLEMVNHNLYLSVLCVYFGSMCEVGILWDGGIYSFGAVADQSMKTFVLQIPGFCFRSQNSTKHESHVVLYVGGRSHRLAK